MRKEFIDRLYQIINPSDHVAQCPSPIAQPLHRFRLPFVFGEAQCARILMPLPTMQRLLSSWADLNTLRIDTIERLICYAPENVSAH